MVFWNTDSILVDFIVVIILAVLFSASTFLLYKFVNRRFVKFIPGIVSAAAAVGCFIRGDQYSGNVYFGWIAYLVFAIGFAAIAVASLMLALILDIVKQKRKSKAAN